MHQARSTVKPKRGPKPIRVAIAPPRVRVSLQRRSPSCALRGSIGCSAVMNNSPTPPRAVCLIRTVRVPEPPKNTTTKSVAIGKAELGRTDPDDQSSAAAQAYAHTATRATSVHSAGTGGVPMSRPRCEGDRDRGDTPRRDTVGFIHWRDPTAVAAGRDPSDRPLGSCGGLLATSGEAVSGVRPGPDREPKPPPDRRRAAVRVPAVDPIRDANTESNVAHVPEVARRTLHSLHMVNRSPLDLLSHTSVTAASDADVLNFSVTDPNQSLAEQLVNEYAQQFILYRQELDTAGVRSAIDGIQTRISALNQTISSNEKSDPVLRGQLRTLLVSQQNLQTLEKLQGGKLLIIDSATTAPQVQPRPIRNAAAGAALGVVLGLGLAFLVEALDTRVRSAEEVGALLRLRLIGRIPAPPRSFSRRNKLAMLWPGKRTHAEAYRNLRTGFDLANLPVSAEVVLIVSAVEKEGKSTTVANLAVALARVGRRVCLVDLDVRRPIIARFFGLEGRPGVTSVATGTVPLQEAVATIGVGGRASSAGSVSGNGAGASQLAGVLQVMPAGPPPLDPAVFLSTAELSEIIGQLRERCDIVLVDSPPALAVGDAMALSSVVDAILVVARAGVVRKASLVELRRLLETAPPAKLGFVLTGAEVDVGYGSGDYGSDATGVEPPVDQGTQSPAST